MTNLVEVDFGFLYLGNKMTRKPFFNAIWFDSHEILLRRVPGVRGVFNPAQHDRDLGLDPMQCPSGSPEEARKFGVPAGKCLKDDLDWISEFSNGMVAGPDWRDSPGTVTEIAFHQALGLPVWEAHVFLGTRFCNSSQRQWTDLLHAEWQLPSLLSHF